MTGFPGSPRVTKGAVVGIDPLSPLANVIVFQYNPDSLTRSLETTGTGGSGKAEQYRISGAPKEQIKVSIEIDATDQLASANPVATSLGVHPQLAALEMLMYPRATRVVSNAFLAALGTIEIVPPEPIMTLFIWGVRRVLPVRITSFSVTEEQHDTQLNPIRAKVELSMQVLSYNDFTITQPGFHLFLSHQVTKEVMATIGSINSLGGL